MNPVVANDVLQSARTEPSAQVTDAERTELETEWLDLTRRELPALAGQRAWPVRFDHCFQRILLDAACGGRWFDHVKGRPAYKAIEYDRLRTAVHLARSVIAATADLPALNLQSLAWRGKL